LPANPPGSIDPSRWPLSQRAGLKGHERDGYPDRDTRSRTVAKTLPRPSVTPHWFVGTRAEKEQLAGIFDALEWTRTTTLYTEDKALNLVQKV
jgi:hypothetical protein